MKPEKDLLGASSRYAEVRDCGQFCAHTLRMII